jgi:hypothetical protein
LLGRRDNEVSETALRILASMKRDWMQASNLASVFLISFVRIATSLLSVADWEEA